MRVLKGKLPRYRDPVTSNVARLLLRALQEQHRAPSSTHIEFEARLGGIVGNTRSRNATVPVAFCTPAIIDHEDRRLVKFVSGVPVEVYLEIEAAIEAAGMATVPQLRSESWPRDAHIELANGKRVWCKYGSARDFRGSIAETVSAVLASPVTNPQCLREAAVVQSAEVKKRVAAMDLCCPGWCSDLRFSLASEQTVPVTEMDIMEETALVTRLRARCTLPVGPFLSLHLTHVVEDRDVWWYPPRGTARELRSRVSSGVAQEAAGSGVGFCFPTVSTIFRKGLLRKHDLMLPSESLSLEVEIEVDMPAVLREWKRLYGGAAVSTYLSTAAVVETTESGSLLRSTPTVVSSPVEMSVTAEGSDRDVRAMLLSERVDAFLMRVAEEVMTLAQFLTKVRVV